MNDARSHWNERYSTPGRGESPVAPFLLEMSRFLPDAGSALDLGGGSGRNALWLAARGLETTLADISDVALEQGLASASELGLEVECLQCDLEAEGLPAGRAWDVALMHLYFPRALLAQVPTHIEPGGLLMFCQPTVVNLQRHERPGRRYLVEPGELESVAAAMTEMTIVEMSEGWRASGRHDAWLVARRR